MQQWEHVTRLLGFSGPTSDPWPERDYYNALLADAPPRSVLVGPEDDDVIETDEGLDLTGDYFVWRQDVESEYLNDFGAAGFQLVAVDRRYVRPTSLIPGVHIHMYFVRPYVADAPPPPPARPIGFQMGRDQAT